MRIRVARSGNSLALCIPRSMAGQLGIAEGRDVELAVEEGRLVVRTVPPGLGALLAGVTDDNLPCSFDDPARGAEQLQAAAPDRGDLVWLDFAPQAGHEQAGRRPALVLSPHAYHQRTPYAVVCPITGRVKGYPFEVPLPDGLPITGAVLADKVKSVDRRARRIEIAGCAPAQVVATVQGRIRALLEG